MTKASLLICIDGAVQLSTRAIHDCTVSKQHIGNFTVIFLTSIVVKVDGLTYPVSFVLSDSEPVLEISLPISPLFCTFPWLQLVMWFHISPPWH
jgi:hypothetical protein